MSNESLYQWLDQVKQNVDNAPYHWPFVQIGKVKKASQYIIEAQGLNAKIGELCKVTIDKHHYLMCTVVGFNDGIIYLMSMKEVSGIYPGADVIPLGQTTRVPVGPGVLGRVLNANGEPLDKLGPLQNVKWVPVNTVPLNPLERDMIKDPFDVGVRALNALNTMGIGQRIGLFAGSGVGKSVLLGMMTKFSKADIVVISLVGERGREVKEFIEHNLDKSVLPKTVIIASPADASPLSRIHAAENASFIAETFREQGKQVLLVMDSITRYAQAIRELGLSMGEPPTAKGYPPSVFTKIPKLIERAGMGGDKHGSVTAIYTVLAEGDDQHDPIVDCARGVLDGHIVLSRQLAEEGHFPAIDIERSISRVMSSVVEPELLKMVKLFKKSYHKYNENKDFILLGAYQKGSDPVLDKVLENIEPMKAFLQQNYNEGCSLDQSRQLLSVFQCLEQSLKVNNHA